MSPRRIAIALGLCLGFGVPDASSAPADRTGTAPRPQAAQARLDCGRAVRPRQPATDPRGLVLGLNAGLGAGRGRERCRRATLTRILGVSTVREEFSWSLLEPRPGQFDWTATDALVLDAARHGLRVLPLLQRSPAWASPSRWALPPDPRSYAGFVAAVVRRYGVGGTYWKRHRRLTDYAPTWFELWNEPYNLTFSGGAPDPSRYASLVRAAVAAGRQGNRRARFLVAAETTFRGADGVERPWLEAMYAAVPDLDRFLDGVAIHPYSFLHGPRYWHPERDARVQTQRFRMINAILARHGNARARSWITEIGWTTCAQAPPGCVAEDVQARYLRTVLRQSATSWRRMIDAVFVYALQDDVQRFPPGSKEAHFGLIRADGTLKPSWRAVSDTTRQLRRPGPDARLAEAVR